MFWICSRTFSISVLTQWQDWRSPDHSPWTGSYWIPDSSPGADKIKLSPDPLITLQRIQHRMNMRAQTHCFLISTDLIRIEHNLCLDSLDSSICVSSRSSATFVSSFFLYSSSSSGARASTRSTLTSIWFSFAVRSVFSFSPSAVRDETN